MLFENFEFRLLQEKDFDMVWKLVLDEFVKREPGSVTLNLSEDEARIFLGKMAKDGILHGTSIGAFDKQTKALIGICISLLGTKPQSSTDSSKDPKRVQQYNKMLSRLTPPEEVMGTRNYMQLPILCVKESHSNASIGAELFKRSEKIARNLGCEKIFTFASSAFTLKICNKFGYDIKKEIFYEDYIDPISGNKIFENIPYPHVKCALVIKTL